MRYNQYFILFMTAVLLGMSGCSKKDLLKYDDTTLGSSIYFAENYTNKIQTQKDISFGYVAANVTDSILRIPVYATGSPADTDRTVLLQFADTSTMIEGVDFNFYRPPVMRAGRVLDTLLVILHRTTQLKDTTLQLGFKLLPNAQFNTAIPYYYSSSVDSVSLLNYTITLNDIAGTSYIWTSTKYKTIALAYFGTYSLTKVQLMMSVLGLSSSVFFDDSTSLPTALVLGWATYMKTWLASEKLAGRIYYDEFGNQITMGASA